MSETEILSCLQGLIHTNFEIPAEQITADAQLRAHLGLDSLDLVDLTFFIERAFQLDVKPHEYRGLSTVAEIVNVIHQRHPA